MTMGLPRILRIALIIYVCAVVIALAPVTYYYSWIPFENHGFEIMKNLNSDKTKTALRNMFDQNYNFTELYQWEHSKVVFVNGSENFERSDDPLRILQIAKGKCGEFSELYVALCLAQGYQSRLVVAADIGPLYLITPHSWAEVKLNGRWTHVDPSDQIWNQNVRYSGWSWGKRVGLNVHIYAFEDGKVADVTQNYMTATVISIPLQTLGTVLLAIAGFFLGQYASDRSDIELFKQFESAYREFQAPPSHNGGASSINYAFHQTAENWKKAAENKRKQAIRNRNFGCMPDSRDTFLAILVLHLVRKLKTASTNKYSSRRIRCDD